MDSAFTLFIYKMVSQLHVHENYKIYILNLGLRHRPTMCNVHKVTFRYIHIIHYQVNGLLFGQIIPYDFCSCVPKIILTEKLFGVGSSHFGFVHLDYWATHNNKLKIRGQNA